MPRSPGAGKRVWVALLLAGLGGGWLWRWMAARTNLVSIGRLVRWRFPSVRQISTEEFAQWMQSGRHPPLVLDVREPEAYAVSHLPGAQRLDFDATELLLNPDMPKNAPVVTYCSVGYRAAAMAQRLQAAGYTNVQSLEGSIFKWANEDRPLVRENNQPATQVYPYSNYWSRLVKPERRAPLPVK